MVERLKQIRRNILGKATCAFQRLQFKEIKVGRRFFSQRHLFINRSGFLHAGDNVKLGRYNHIGCGVEIGNDVIIASFVAFVGGDHKIDNI